MKKIIENIKKYWVETGVGVSFSFVMFFIWLWKNAVPHRKFIYWLTAFLSVCSLFALLYFLWKLWMKNRHKIGKFIRNLYVKVGRGFILFLEKIKVRRTKGNILSGKTTIIFDFPDLKKGKKSEWKRLKWKQLEDDRQRLGYLYAHMITQKIDDGKSIYACETPNEIARKNTENETEGELFGCYSGHRYYEKAPIDGTRLTAIKEILGIK